MVLNKIIDITIDVFGAKLANLKIIPSEINENTNFITDLHADSMDIGAIICEIEEEFNLDIDDDVLIGIETIGDVADRIKDLV